jgi:hypothetical protein
MYEIFGILIVYWSETTQRAAGMFISDSTGALFIDTDSPAGIWPTSWSL